MAADNDPDTTGVINAVPIGTSSEIDQHVVQHEQPEDWGWHHEFSKGRQIGGWFSFLVLAAFLTATHYNHAGSLAIIIIMVLLAGGLIWDRQRKRTQWRS